MSETVIREVTRDVWTFSRPFSRFGLIPIGGRTTAILLERRQSEAESARGAGMNNRPIWVFASTPLDEPTRTRLDSLGRVAYIVGGDAAHHLYLREYKEFYPNAKLIGIKEMLSQPHLKGLAFAGVYGRDPPGTRYGFEDEIQSCHFTGFVNKDVAFHHKASRTLIEADLLVNLPPTEQYSKARSSGHIPLFGNMNPYSWTHKQFLRYASYDKDAMQRAARTVSGWDFDRIIPCHGDVIETDGKKAWLEAFRFFLD